MRLLRDVSGAALVAALSHAGDVIMRQKMIARALFNEDARGAPHHDFASRSSAGGDPNAILKDVVEHAGLTRDEVAETLFG